VKVDGPDLRLPITTSGGVGGRWRGDPPGPIDAAMAARHDAGMQDDVDDVPDAWDEEGDAGLDSRELARIRRRDHDADAEQHALMRPGMGKVFKQVTDSWSRDASPDQKRARKGAAKGHDRPR
jgi:hypothetical protein